MRQPLCTVKFGPSEDTIVATLGDALASTCSIEFAKTYLAPEGGVILGYGTFEEAAAAVTQGEADLLVVPGAYPEIRAFIFDPALELADTFRDRLPTIVLVSGNADKDPTTPPDTLYYHPALEREVRVLLETWGTQVKLVEVTSNPVACEKALCDDKSYALTNEIAAEAYKVATIATVCKGNLMPCSVFWTPRVAQVDLRPILGFTPRRSKAPASGS